MARMKMTVQARLDRQSQAALESLKKRLGWSQSRIVREGLRLLASRHMSPQHPKIIGIGRFASGVADLGSNKSHLEGFGR